VRRPILGGLINEYQREAQSPDQMRADSWNPTSSAIRCRCELPLVGHDARRERPDGQRYVRVWLDLPLPARRRRVWI
jgi:hypothetical protein